MYYVVKLNINFKFRQNNELVRLLKVFAKRNIEITDGHMVALMAIW